MVRLLEGDAEWISEQGAAAFEELSAGTVDVFDPHRPPIAAAPASRPS